LSFVRPAHQGAVDTKGNLGVAVSREFRRPKSAISQILAPCSGLSTSSSVARTSPQPRACGGSISNSDACFGGGASHSVGGCREEIDQPAFKRLGPHPYVETTWTVRGHSQPLWAHRGGCVQCRVYRLSIFDACSSGVDKQAWLFLEHAGRLVVRRISTCRGTAWRCFENWQRSASKRVNPGSSACINLGGIRCRYALLSGNMMGKTVH
jgi:hypothetical protein